MKRASNGRVTARPVNFTLEHSTLPSGPNKGAAKPITPATRWSPDERLVC